MAERILWGTKYYKTIHETTIYTNGKLKKERYGIKNRR